MQIDNLSDNNPLLSIFLILLGFTNFILADTTIEATYVWTFRILSLVSVICVILINRRNAWRELKKIFNNDRH